MSDLGQNAKNSVRANIVRYSPLKRTLKRGVATSLMGHWQTLPTA